MTIYGKFKYTMWFYHPSNRINAILNQVRAETNNFAKLSLKTTYWKDTEYFSIDLILSASNRN
jgi:hypothetical protein